MRDKTHHQPSPHRRPHHLSNVYSSDLMILTAIRIDRYWSFHLGLFTWRHFISNIHRLFFEAFILHYNNFFQSMFTTMMYPPKGFIFITIDLLFVGLNFIYLFIIYIWMISKHYILLFQQNFIWFYTKDKISVFSNSNPTKYSVDGQKLLHTLKTHPLERILGLSAKDIKNHFIPFDTD